MLLNIKKAKDEDAVKLAEQKRMILVRADEIKKANAAAIELKDEAKKREKALEDEILKIQKQKLEAEEAHKRELARQKEEKERETQRLREMQERANDRQAELDEIRAKKAYEARVKADREKLQAEQAKHRALLKDLEVSRRAQFKDKEARIAEENRKDRELALQTVAEMKRAEEKERQEHVNKLAMVKRHQTDLVSQIGGNAEKRKQDQFDYEEQGRQLRQAHENERQKILAIKDKKLGQLD